MSDIVERLHTVSRGDHGDCMGREYICTCGFDDAAWDAAEEAATEIARLRAELAEARDKALDEAAGAVMGYVHPDWPRLPGEAFATAQILALKSTKPPIL